ncbi:MAG TPA: response regulator [Bacteroidales bacterium]|nr:response regulator [Bacteroidales bacterium]
MLVVNLQQWPKNGANADEMASFFWHTLDSIAPLITITKKDAISYANRRFCQFTGFEKDEIPNSFSQLVFYDKHIKGFEEELRDLLQSNQTWVKQIVLRHKDGLPEEYEVSFFPKNYQDSDAEKFLVLVPVRWYRKGEEFGESGHFSSFQATEPDLYNTLKSLGALCKILQNSVISEQQSELLRQMEIALGALTGKVNELLRKMTNNGDSGYSQPKPFNFAEALHTLSAKYQNAAEQKGIRFTTLIETSLPKKVYGDQALLEQTLESSLEYLLGRGDTKIISFEALSELQKDEVSEVSFFIMGVFGENQAYKESSLSESSSHGNDIEHLFSRINKSGGKVLLGQMTGKSFYLHFLMKYKLDLPVASNIKVEIPFEEEKFPDNTLVLIAEDDELNQMVMKQHHLKMGLNTHFARTGFNVLEKIRNQPYDLIIMDTQMPGLGGEQTIKAIRADQNAVYSEIPIIGISASFSEEVKDRCLKAGANDFITKPYEPSDMRNKMVHLVNWYRKKVNKDTERNLKTEFLPPMEKYFDLTYLEETSEGDKEFSSTMISFFVENTPTVLDNLKSSIQTKDWEAVRQIAHKLKPQVIYMGIHIIKDEVEKIEHLANIKTNLNEIPDLASKTEKYCFLAIEQLKEELKKYEMG